MSSVVSFRDPGGICFGLDSRILRIVNQASLNEIEPFLASSTAREMWGRGDLVSCKKLSPAEVEHLRQNDRFRQLEKGRDVAAVFEHTRIEFPSYPYEWAPEMLYAAAELTLNLAQSALKEGYSLKDATPYNVLFNGPKPVFIDLLSFEKRNPADPVWKPHAQFARTFLLPLLAHKYWGIRLADVFVKRRDGLDPVEVYQWCSLFQRFHPLVLTQVSIPKWLSSKAKSPSVYREHLMDNHEKARFILDSLFNRLRRALKAVKPREAKDTVWSDYMESHSYSDTNFKAKEAFVKEALAQFKPARVLDIGANTGHFSVLAAQSGAQVVSVDYDWGCIGTLWQQAKARQLSILPMVIDLSRPSAAKGWRNRECISFLDRAMGTFDGVLMLAVLHHLLVTERVPLPEVLDLAADITREWLVIEYVGPADEMFRTLTRGRDHLHADLTEAVFEQACAARFTIVRSQKMQGSHRTLYLLKKNR